jgi:hypothetical protein
VIDRAIDHPPHLDMHMIMLAAMPQLIPFRCRPAHFVYQGPPNSNDLGLARYCVDIRECDGKMLQDIFPIPGGP